MLVGLPAVFFVCKAFIVFLFCFCRRRCCWDARIRTRRWCVSDWIFVAEGRTHARTHSSTRASPVMVLMVLGGERGKEGCVREERKEGEKKDLEQ